jgi:hypothetical protein
VCVHFWTTTCASTSLISSVLSPYHDAHIIFIVKASSILQPVLQQVHSRDQLAQLLQSSRALLHESTVFQQQTALQSRATQYLMHLNNDVLAELLPLVRSYKSNHGQVFVIGKELESLRDENLKTMISRLAHTSAEAELFTDTLQSLVQQMEQIRDWGAALMRELQSHADRSLLVQSVHAGDVAHLENLLGNCSALSQTTASDQSMGSDINDDDEMYRDLIDNMLASEDTNLSFPMY